MTTSVDAPTPERWQQIEEVFGTAVSLEGAEREAYLDRACAEDRELRDDVESLLARSVTARATIGATVAAEASELAATAASAWVGRRIGPYRLVSLVGEGGMGVVYLAERDDDAYRGRVAIKLLHYGLASRAAIARFRDERQILAALQHANIVHLLDGGSTDEGVPYLVMEYVEGVPITQHARERGLDVHERLTVFESVCAAVQYAHQQLVVHRDLKPSNVLVDATGTPKLLDFGIAKLMDADGPTGEARTRTGVLPLTPEYASPEQARGAPVATTTDVYSLGAVLFELLADRPPLEIRGRGPEALREVIEREPPRPSQVAPAGRTRALAGDLDNIVLQALHKDPAQRYASVEQLANDLRRYRDGLPVRARPTTLGYRAGKLVRRHGGKLAIGAAFVIALTSTTFYSLRQAQRADEAAARERRRFDDVRELATSLLVELDAKIRDLRGSTPAREWVVERALAYLDRLASENSGDRRLERELAVAYMKIGDIQGSATAPSLGRAAEGLASYAKARALLERIRAESPDDVDTRSAIVVERYGRGLLEVASGDLRAARADLEAASREALALPADHLDPDLALRGCGVLGQLEIWQSDLDPALAQATDCVTYARRWQAHEPSSPLAEYWIGVALDLRGIVHVHRGEPALAVADTREGIAVLAALGAAHPEDQRFAHEVATGTMQLAVALGGLGDSEIWSPNTGDRAAAEVELRRSVHALEALAAKDPDDHRALLDYTQIMANLATLVGERDPTAAIPMFEQANAAVEALPAAEQNEFYLRQGQWLSHCAMSTALARLGRRTEAIEQGRRGLAMLDSGDALVADYRLACTYLIAVGREALGDHDVAADLLDAVTAEIERRLESHVVIADLVGLDASLALYAQVRPADACRLRRRARVAWRAWHGPDSTFVRDRVETLDRALATCR